VKIATYVRSSVKIILQVVSCCIGLENKACIYGTKYIFGENVFKIYM